MLLPNRNASTDGYRYGFNGKEKDDELKGIGNSIDFGARMYDPRIGRWFATDKDFQLYPNQSAYSFSLNNPIKWDDDNGKHVKDPDGNIIVTIDEPNAEYTVSSLDSKTGLLTSYSFSAKKGRILTDKGNEVVVYIANNDIVTKKIQQVSTDKYGNALADQDGNYIVEKEIEKKKFDKTVFDCSYNCTGNALTNKKFTISSDLINKKYLNDEGLKKKALSDAKKGDVGMYHIRKESGKVVHLEIFLDNNQNVSTKGGIQIDPGPIKAGESTSFKEGSVYVVYEKTQLDMTLKLGGVNSKNEFSLKEGETYDSDASNGISVVNKKDFKKIKKAVKKKVRENKKSK